MRRQALSPQAAHASKVALAATLLIAVVYAGCAVILNQIVAGRLTGQLNGRLTERLADFTGPSRNAPGRADDDDMDVDGAPVFLWLVGGHDSAVRLSTDGPTLPTGTAPASGQTRTARLGPGTFMLRAARSGQSVLVAGQSMAEEAHIIGLLRDGELLGAPVLLLAMFAGSLVIGLRALSPVEHSRRRQLEFTADASHELRTPLSVISAETSIALSTPRSAADYRSALVRVDGESQRLRHIVEDMLWLARFDSNPPPPSDEPLDLSTIAAECADRFAPVARSRSFDISVVPAEPLAAWISAPPEWIDRLAGVLADNACRYAGPGGAVRISVVPRGNRVGLVVEDSGPGVPEADRARLFDRFHRSTEQGGSAGLGLAIADSIARSTGGHWRIGESALGGALFEVSWRRYTGRQHGAAAWPAVPDGDRRAAGRWRPSWPRRRRPAAVGDQPADRTESRSGEPIR
jgi:signal transduction histidine kinase